MTVTPSKTTMVPGDTFKITISVSNIQLDGGYKTINTGITFDTNVFEYETGDWTKDVQGLNGFNMYANEKTGKLQATNIANVTEPSDVCTVALKVKSTVTPGSSYDITTVDTDIANNSNQITSKEEGKGTISIKNISVKEESGLKIDDDKIEGVTPGTDKKGLTDNINVAGGTVQVVDKDGKEVSDDTKIGTGMQVKTSDGTTYTVVVKGDLNGDGLINIGDTVKMKKHIVETEKLTGIYLQAADIDEDGFPAKAKDLARLVDYQLNLIDKL